MEDIGIYLAKDIKTEVKNFKEVQNFLKKVMENFIEESLKFMVFTNFFLLQIVKSKCYLLFSQQYIKLQIMFL